MSDHDPNHEEGQPKHYMSVRGRHKGLRAYAEGQGQLQRDLASSFSKKWAALLAGEVADDDLAAAAEAESDDELDGAGAGSEEEAMEEADEEDEGMLQYPPGENVPQVTVDKMIAVYGDMQEESWRYTTNIGHGRTRQYLTILLATTYEENIISARE
ncbi:hypothetical protein PILCRDRAFT_92511 [Piloderma croceum F 1598]|uniref:Uncharacterized protein n=1 Tax=Piloderma croceum (strain F 1598) TaxID=765440 RepID=A0A0C3BB24_PILCF|nr:hypothetical protein PILCRDRAFT_92511 [Piloderma croceum F 1598]